MDREGWAPLLVVDQETGALMKFDDAWREPGLHREVIPGSFADKGIS